jgi:2-(1,2-epoxy-1,2-dihydrophenyl)acetyl-CoA isomerase
VVPADDLPAESADLARRLADGPTVAYGAIRRAVEFSSGHDFASSVAFEAEMMALTGATADHRNAVDAFVAKQQPVFEGR